MFQDSHVLLLIHQLADWWVLSAAAFRSMWAEWNTPSHPEGQRFKSPWWQKQKVFFCCKWRLKMFYFKSVCKFMPNVLKKRDDSWCSKWNHHALNHVLSAHQTAAIPLHYTSLYNNWDFQVTIFTFCFKEGKKYQKDHLKYLLNQR